MGGDINSMTIDQASRRIDFTPWEAPTYNPSETKANINENIRVAGFNIENAYPWTCLYEEDGYRAFIKNPLDRNAKIE